MNDKTLLVTQLSLGVAAVVAATVLAANAGRVGQTPAAHDTVKRSIANLGTTQRQSGFDRFIVRYRDGSAPKAGKAAMMRAVDAAALRTRQSLRGTYGGRGAPFTVHYVRALATGAEALRTSRRLSLVETNALLAELRADPTLQYAQVDGFKHRTAVPNDPRLADLQWDMTDNYAGIRAPGAWDHTAGEGLVVAVLDTGYAEHADLTPNIVPGYDFVSYYGQAIGGETAPDVAGDGDGRDADARDPGDWVDESMSAWCGNPPQPSSWHGTHVAGTVAAVGNNGIDIAGAAYNAKVQPVRVLGHCGGLTSDIADAIVWASGGHVDGVPDNADPAEVLNLSLGGSGPCSDDPVTQDAINGANARGVTVVVAAGNQNQNAANYSPASCAGVITVGASDWDARKSWFSNYGASITLSAPGGNAQSMSAPDTAWIWSLGNAGETVPIAGAAGDALIGMIGTSQASPHVAGVVAMMQSASVAAGHAPLTPVQAKNMLKSTARPYGARPPTGTPMGAGIVSANAAVEAAIAGIGEGEQATVLSNRIATTGLGGGTGDTLLFSITVPPGMRSLNLRTYGGVGDVSLYAARDRAATASDHDRVAAHPGNSEAIAYVNPVPGVYYLRLVGARAFADVSVLATYQ